jgi:hypothetical protein
MSSKRDDDETDRPDIRHIFRPKSSDDKENPSAYRAVDIAALI